ncbi:MAG: lytic murein transglycosylase [Mycobacteriales bacterium]
MGGRHRHPRGANEKRSAFSQVAALFAVLAILIAAPVAASARRTTAQLTASQRAIQIEHATAKQIADGRHAKPSRLVVSIQLARTDTGAGSILGPAVRLTLTQRYALRLAVDPRLVGTATGATAAQQADTVASRLVSNGIPAVALQAYRSAAYRVGGTYPACHLPWGILAGIGRVESDHGQFGGSVPLANGNLSKPIVGFRLDGTVKGFKTVPDTDHGALDGDPVYDDAVGPMQFMPATWRAYGIDADGNGVADPQNLFDATVAAANYLCSTGQNLSTPAGQVAAILDYNHSLEYVAMVRSLSKAYMAGLSGTTIPDGHPVADGPVAAPVDTYSSVATTPTATGKAPLTEPPPVPTTHAVPPPATTKAATTQPSTTEPPTTNLSTTEPSATKPSATTKPPTTTPPMTTPSTTTPPTTTPPTTEPPTSAPPTTTPPTTEPPTTTPPTTTPPSTEPSTTTTTPSPTPANPRPPTAPADLTLIPSTKGAINLSWGPSRRGDSASPVQGYVVQVDGLDIKTIRRGQNSTTLGERELGLTSTKASVMVAVRGYTTGMIQGAPATALVLAGPTVTIPPSQCVATASLPNNVPADLNDVVFYADSNGATVPVTQVGADHSPTINLTNVSQPIRVWADFTGGTTLATTTPVPGCATTSPSPTPSHSQTPSPPTSPTPSDSPPASPPTSSETSGTKLPPATPAKVQLQASTDAEGDVRVVWPATPENAEALATVNGTDLTSKTAHGTVSVTLSAADLRKDVNTVTVTPKSAGGASASVLIAKVVPVVSYKDRVVTARLANVPSGFAPTSLVIAAADGTALTDTNATVAADSTWTAEIKLSKEIDRGGQVTAWFEMVDRTDPSTNAVTIGATSAK